MVIGAALVSMQHLPATDRPAVDCGGAIGSLATLPQSLISQTGVQPTSAENLNSVVGRSQSTCISPNFCSDNYVTR